MRYWLFLVFLLIGTQGFAQQNLSQKLVQVSGLISDLDSNRVVPYATITNLRNAQNYSADYRGFFSIITHPGDTLSVSSIGYKTVQRIVPSNYDKDQLTYMIQLKAELVFIQAVRIYPWATVEDFTRSFLALKIADDAMATAKKNLSGKSLREMGLTLPRDAGEIMNTNNRLEHDRMLNKNMVQTNPLLNPFAWGKLIQSITNGDKKRNSEN